MTLTDSLSAFAWRGYQAAPGWRAAVPSIIRLRVPQDMHVDEITLSDGSKLYDVLTSPAA